MLRCGLPAVGLHPLRTVSAPLCIHDGSSDDRCALLRHSCVLAADLGLIWGSCAGLTGVHAASVPAAPAFAGQRCAQQPHSHRAARVQVQALTTGVGGKKINKVVLAYSGGLDTSVILRWLQETYDCEVVTFTADLGQVRTAACTEADMQALVSHVQECAGRGGRACARQGQGCGRQGHIHR